MYFPLFVMTHVATFADVSVRQALLRAVDEVRPPASVINSQQIILNIIL